MSEAENPVREAIALIDEINERAKSREFYGIDQVLHAKLCTIRATLARHRAQGSEPIGFRAIKPASPYHAAVLEDLARRIDDE